MNEDTMDESTVIENKQNENKPTPIEPSDTKIEEQNLPDPEIEENVDQQEGRENIPAIAALLLQNTGNMSKLKEIKEFSNKNENRIETFQKIVLSEALTNESPLPDSELENSNSCQEKIIMNSKDSSMLSTTDTQDEIETIDNGDQTFTNHLDEQAVISALCKRAKQELLESSDSEDSVEEMLGSDLDSQTEETFSIVSGSEYDEASQGSIQDEHFETPVPMDNGNEKWKLFDFKINKQKNNDCMADEQNKTPTDNQNENPKLHDFEIKKEENNDSITDGENNTPTDNENENPNFLDFEIKKEENNDSITDGENNTPTDNENENPNFLDFEIKKEENNDSITDGENNTPTDNENENPNFLDFEIKKEENNDSLTDGENNTPTDNQNPNFLDFEIIKEVHNDSITDGENNIPTNNENPNFVDFEIKIEVNYDCITNGENEPHTDNGNENPKLLDIEIYNDENNVCVTDNVNKTTENKNNGNTEKAKLRRSSRTVKVRKYSYDYADSETDESDSEDTPERKSRPIMINDTKSLVEIAARQSARSTAFDRREPQLVLIGSKPKQAPSVPTAKNISSSINTSLYQSIVARGTTVTPISSRPAPTTTSQAVQTSPTPMPVLLPSLTDDMFVVEAPSFIVPYVYEKPSIERFKEVVTKLGKNIEEQRAKAGKELLQKKMEEKYKQQKERQEGIYQEKEETDSEEEASQEVEENMSKIPAIKRQHGLEEGESSCDGSVSSDTDDNGTTVLEGIKNTGGVPASSPSTSNSYFDGSLGKFFMNIGMGLVEEYVQRDLLKTQQRKLQREKKSGYSSKQRELENSIKVLTKNYEMSKDNNKSLKCVQLKCEHCTFKTESEIVLAQHMETPHMKNNMYKCNFCEFEIRSPQDILFHMEAEHNVRGRLERAPAYHQCVNCAFEDNGKSKLARHVIACAKKFKPDHNLSPPVDWEPPAKIPKIAKGRQTMLGASVPMTGPFGRPQAPMNLFGRPHPSTNSFGRSPIPSLLPSTSNCRPRLRNPGLFIPRPVVAGGSIVRGSSIQQQTAAAQAAAIAKKNHPSISITPVPARSVPPRPVPPRPLPPRPVISVFPPHESATSTFVICEICDGYIKDLEQLRNHMQWIHKVKIHPKMIYNRPPLNCQKCQFRFFTDLGLERHLLGSHGLVTTSMQDAANKNKDSGRCPICGKVFQCKLLNHMVKDHAMTLKPAHLSYKCTVCCATFEMYKQFECHVYSAHSVVANRVMDKVPVPVPVPVPVQARSIVLPKGLKINTEITITAQPARPSKNK